MRHLLPVLALATTLVHAAPVTTHPRLLFRAEDLPALRARMSPSNDTWLAFKTEVVDPCLRDWKCSATHHYSGPPNYIWIRDSFTDENGVVHLPGDADWSTYSDSNARPAAPEDDVGEPTGNIRMFSEQYAMIFAFMARMTKDDPAQAAAHAEYLTASRECLFRVVDAAHLGVDNSQPWRQSNFAQNDRSFSAEAFALAVDWIYEDLTPVELAKIRKTFLVWAAQTNDHAYYSPTKTNGSHGPVNSTALLRLPDPQRAEIRLALNNHWANHLRQLVLYSLALDPKDDVPVTPASPAAGIVTDDSPPGSLTSHITGPGGAGDWLPVPSGHLRDTLGVWLYLTDYAYRHDGAGGLSVEGLQYATNGLGPIALAMFALHTAGQDDPARWGPQVSLARHPLWSRQIPTYLAQLPPAPRVNSNPNYTYYGPHFQPPVYGDLESYVFLNDQFIKVLAPMGLYDARVNGSAGAIAQAARYIQRQLAPGGATRYDERIRSMRGSKTLRDAIYYFLLMDPAAPAAADPRPALQPDTFLSMHDIGAGPMGMVIARSGPAATDTLFHWRNDWNKIDHQRGDSLSFGLWKNGLWLTKVMAGYGILEGCADYRNSLSLQNGTPTANPVGETILAAHGSQWDYSPIADPVITARSTGKSFLAFTGDATNLYTHRTQTTLREITHASRSIVWLKPDHLIVYDRATSKQSGYYKRFYLNLPAVEGAVTVTGNTVHATAAEGTTPKAELFVTTLLPAAATPQLTDISSGNPSNGEDMKSRMFTTAPGNPADARFLHVIQGANAGTATPTTSQNLTAAAGDFEGAILGTTCVMFRKTPGTGADGLAYTHPATVTSHYLTGLTPFAGYDISQTATTVAVTGGGTQRYADGGGTLVLGGAEPPNIELTATDSTGSETGDTLTFLLKRSGDTSTALTVGLAADTTAGTATAADLTNFTAQAVFAPGAATTTLTLTPADDAAYEGTEELVLRLTASAIYHPAATADTAAATITDNDSPPGGTLGFSAATYSALENSGTASITLTRTGGSTGTASIHLTTANGTATAADYTAVSQTVTWPAGDTTPQTVAIPLSNNATYTGSRTVLLQLDSPAGQVGLGPAAAVLTILDDEPAPPGNFKLTPTAITVPENGTPSITFDIARTGGDGGPVTVQYATAAGSATAGTDFTATTGTHTWAALDSHTAHLTVPLADDTLYEGTETFTFVLTNPTGGAGFDGPATATVTLTDDDPPPATFHAGPGQSYATPRDIPWPVVTAGSDIYIHYDPAGYHQKLLLSARGTADHPVRLIGIPGPNGERPILDGDAALPPLAPDYAAFTSTEDQSLIAIERDNAKAAAYKPGYLEIHGLELRNAHPDFGYTRQAGGPDTYATASAAIYLNGAEHIRIRDCVIHHCANGIVTSSGGSVEPGLVRDLVIDRCHFHDNGKSGQYYGKNLQTQGLGVTLQYSRLDPPLSGTNVPNVEDKSAGFTARCNWLEGGSSQFDLAEPFGSVPLLTADPGWSVIQLSGNLLRNFSSGSGTIVHFGGSEIAGARTLHFHHNTIHIQNGYGRTLVNVRAADETALVSNNAVLHQSLTECRLLGTSGAAQYGRNFISPGYTAPPPGVTGAANILTGPAIGFTNAAAGDYRPATGSPLLDAALALPAGALPVSSQYHLHARGAARPPAAGPLDLGALEAALPPDTTDPDHDGLPNAIEAALGTDPGAPNPTPLQVTLTAAGGFSLAIAKAPTSGGLTFVPEVSTDLQTWQPMPLQLDTPTLLEAHDTAPPNTSHRFLRLRVTR